MTVYQEIVNMDKGTLVKWIVKLLRADESFCADIYCRLFCEYRLPNGECSVPNGGDCVVGNESSEKIISKWLDSESQEIPYKRLRRELKQRNISIRKCAIDAGIVPQSLYAAMNGRTEFWAGWKKKIADSFGMELSDLFEE